MIPQPWSGMSPRDWADALTMEVSMPIPAFRPEQTWQQWANDLTAAAGRVIDVPQPQDFQQFDDWATVFFRSNDGGRL